MVKGKGRNWEQLSGGIMQILGLLDVYVSLLGLPVLFLILVAWRAADNKPLLHDTRIDDTKRPAPMRAQHPIRVTSPCSQRRARWSCGASP